MSKQDESFEIKSDEEKQIDNIDNTKLFVNDAESCTECGKSVKIEEFDESVESFELAEEVKEVAEVAEILIKTSGCCVCAITILHPVKCVWDIILKLVLSMIIIVQLTIPSVLFAISIGNYNEGVCPNTGTLASRILVSMIGILYFTRTFLFFSDKFSDYAVVGKEIGLPNDCELNKYLQLDDFMQITYEGCVYLVNLFIIYISNDPMDIVLNSLAMEFVLKLDDEIKEVYFKKFDKISEYVRDNNMLEEDWKPSESCCLECAILTWTLITPILNYLTMYALPILSLAFAIYAPICKP